VARDAATGRRVAGSDPYRAQEAVAYLGVDQDGRRVALSENTGDVEVVEVATGQQLAVLDPTPGAGPGTAPQQLAFSPDGRWLATGSDSGEVTVWDTRTWEEAATWRVVGGGVQSLVFTADSQTLLAGGGGRAWLRTVADPGAAAATVELDPLRTGGSVSVGSREDGRVLVTHTDHSGLQLWQVAPEALLEHACRVAGRDLTEEEWATALPDRPYERTCP
jgi:WD40 repeat protein